MYKAWQPCSKTSSTPECRCMAAEIRRAVPSCKMRKRLGSRTAKFSSTAQAPDCKSAMSGCCLMTSATSSMPPASVARSTASSLNVRFHNASTPVRSCSASQSLNRLSMSKIDSTPPASAMALRLPWSVKVRVSKAVHTWEHTESVSECCSNSVNRGLIWWPSCSETVAAKAMAFSALTRSLTSKVGTVGASGPCAGGNVKGNDLATVCDLWCFFNCSFSSTSLWTKAMTSLLPQLQTKSGKSNSSLFSPKGGDVGCRCAPWSESARPFCFLSACSTASFSRVVTRSPRAWARASASPRFCSASWSLCCRSCFSRAAMRAARASARASASSHFCSASSSLSCRSCR
mmetsp:Transcript_23000/g.66676  ORF Transcript_23000/g.66676 Transcript_23000/m.66676 type:complete len:346 (-) Transcript_23000:244-1281(-)